MVTSCAAADLQCSISLEFFNDSCVLHMYWLTYLQGLVRSNLNCPQILNVKLNMKYIPNGDVVSFLYHISILSGLETAWAYTNQEETKICDLCTNGEVAVGYTVRTVASICMNIVKMSYTNVVRCLTTRSCFLTHLCVKHN